MQHFLSWLFVFAFSFVGSLPLTVFSADAALPSATLAEGYSLELAAGSSLVQHPIMGCLDDQGRLFVCDAAGLNLKKDELEKQRPNRVLMLVDSDHDGRFDKSTVFADQMTFPQGACWLNGSLYVGSPPSLWKLTDTNNDGVADKREELVTGFDYTGNAADIHGPFLHPNGRLYWCHGRKGHKVQRVTMINGERTLGEVIHEGMACGIWSCKPDGSDIAWHSLGCGDNPVEVDFTPDGDILGVQNLYYNQPRGDTLVHWLYGGLYERADQLQAIAQEARTLEQMPVVYNFGHVAVSGCCFAKTAPTAANKALQMYVTHFNTQRLVRMELLPDGGSFKATEHEFLKLNDPDIHLTDVMEALDGSLLVFNTGGWFKIGCPSSMMEKPDILGAIYRLRPSKPGIAKLTQPIARTPQQWAKQLNSTDNRTVFLACQALDQQAEALPKTCEASLMKVLSRELDPTTEHAAMHLAFKAFTGLHTLEKTMPPTLLRRLMVINSNTANDNPDHAYVYLTAEDYLDAADEPLARAALALVKESPMGHENAAGKLADWLKQPQLKPTQLAAIQRFASAFVSEPETQALVTTMLLHNSAEATDSALKIIASSAAPIANENWVAPLETMLKKTAGEAKEMARLPLICDAISKSKSPRFDSALQGVANTETYPVTLRLKALSAQSTSKGGKLDDATFALLCKLLADTSNATGRIAAAGLLSHATLTAAQLPTALELVPTLGPLELSEILKGVRKYKADSGELIAAALAKSPVLGSQQESVYRTAFSGWPESVFNTLRPAIAAAVATTDAKRLQLESLSAKATQHGDAKAGRALYESGMGTCVACHQIGDKGRAIGPNLSKIGAIRHERDLLESILFPSNTLARDYEMHALELSDGQSLQGIIKSHSAEGLILVDVAGAEKSVRHDQIIANATLTTSLMPMGLDSTLNETQLLDLVAYLRSLK